MAAAETTYHRFDELERMLTETSDRDELFQEAKFVDLLNDRIDTFMPESGALSLDVFDTLLLRDDSSEITRFYEIGGKLAEIVNASGAVQSDISQSDAFVARYLGTHATYRASEIVKGCREGSLTELHETASRVLTGTADLAEKFVAAELEYESGRMKPSQLILDIMKRVRDNGGKVVLVSDMYMHADQIALLLEKCGVPESTYDLLVSSADTKVSKASGGIFEVVEKRMGKISGYVHLGDSLRGDYQKPKLAGWATIHLPIPDASIAQRRADHLATAKFLQENFGLKPKIAIPA